MFQRILIRKGFLSNQLTTVSVNKQTPRQVMCQPCTNHFLIPSSGTKTKKGEVRPTYTLGDKSASTESGMRRRRSQFRVHNCCPPSVQPHAPPRDPMHSTETLTTLIYCIYITLFLLPVITMTRLFHM